ncbi:hypothetical protein C8Q80DRAFT_1123795 [Daedaleopsis nitida]|nr:hypothetical protein C8Q80DRAFT_1123795 [Daedaleopsis nitida]
MKFSAAALVLAAAAAAFAHVHAQSNSGISPCIVKCINQSKGCFSIADEHCFCMNKQFQREAVACVKHSCSAADMQQFYALEKQRCGSSTCESLLFPPSTRTIPASVVAQVWTRTRYSVAYGGMETDAWPLARTYVRVRVRAGRPSTGDANTIADGYSQSAPPPAST